jgi:SAM-dependent methyltransferase
MASPDQASSDAARNRAAWTESNRDYTDANAADNWALDEITWGVWAVDESELNVLGDVAGLDVVELGCGTAYFSAWLAKRGARPVGVDVTPAQLDTARRMMAETGVEFPLVEADAAETGLPDASFDLALSEYGASIWVDPYRWIPEAARLLRPGGRLVFLRNSTLVVLCLPATGDAPANETLQRPLFGMHRFEWPDDPGVEFHLPHGEWIELLRTNGFEIERLVEVQAPADAETHPYYAFVTADWARQWPAEEIWVARKRADGAARKRADGAPGERG